MNKRLETFKETLKIINENTNLTMNEAISKVERLMELNKRTKVSNSKFQKFLDWLSQPLPEGQHTQESAKATAILMKGYWEAIAARDKGQTPEIHQHLHLHKHEGDNETEQEITDYSQLSDKELLDLVGDDDLLLLE